jgi:hypothetical protein
MRHSSASDARYIVDVSRISRLVDRYTDIRQGINQLYDDTRRLILKIAKARRKPPAARPAAKATRPKHVRAHSRI